MLGISPGNACTKAAEKLPSRPLLEAGSKQYCVDLSVTPQTLSRGAAPLLACTHCLALQTPQKECFLTCASCTIQSALRG